MIIIPTTHIDLFSVRATPQGNSIFWGKRGVSLVWTDAVTFSLWGFCVAWFSSASRYSMRQSRRCALCAPSSLEGGGGKVGRRRHRIAWNEAARPRGAVCFLEIGRLRCKGAISARIMGCLTKRIRRWYALEHMWCASCRLFSRPKPLPTTIGPNERKNIPDMAIAIKGSYLIPQIGADGAGVASRFRMQSRASFARNNYATHSRVSDGASTPPI